MSKEKTHINIKEYKDIYLLYFDPLCKYLNFYTKDMHVIEDIVQEVFVKLWEDRMTVEISQYKAYIFKAARNKMLNYQRNELNRLLLLEKWFDEQINDKDENDEAFRVDRLVDEIFRVVDDLPLQCRDIFLLGKKENMTYKQIAEIKNISVKTVENQMSIALKKIRDRLSLYQTLSIILCK